MSRLEMGSFPLDIDLRELACLTYLRLFASFVRAYYEKEQRMPQYDTVGIILKKIKVGNSSLRSLSRRG